MWQRWQPCLKRYQMFCGRSNPHSCVLSSSSSFSSSVWTHPVLVICLLQILQCFGSMGPPMRIFSYDMADPSPLPIVIRSIPSTILFAPMVSGPYVIIGNIQLSYGFLLRWVGTFRLGYVEFNEHYPCQMNSTFDFCILAFFSQFAFMSFCRTFRSPIAD